MKTYRRFFVFLFLLCVGIQHIYADKYTQNEIDNNPELKKLQDELKADKTSDNTWKKGKYECDAFAKDLQKGLMNNGRESVRIVLKVKSGNDTIVHNIIRTKIDGKNVYIEPQTDGIYKDIENLIKDFLMADSVVEIVKEVPPIYIELTSKPVCSCNLGGNFVVNVKITDCNNNLLNKEFTLEYTDIEGKKTKSKQTTNKKGTWSNTYQPCPNESKALGKYFEFKVIYNGKCYTIEEKIRCKCIRELSSLFKKYSWYALAIILMFIFLLVRRKKTRNKEQEVEKE
ncbi:MAG: hypothetical protein KAQ75_05325 [Bacteroidales bacterium]|nr:hypothetical protein [Bacteroidales bacterium]